MVCPRIWTLGQEFTYAVRAQGRLQTKEELGNIVLRADPSGSIVRFKDVGRIELCAQSYDMIGWLNGKPAALVALYQLPGSNAIEAADGAKKMMTELKTRFPKDLDYVFALDITLAVTEGINELEAARLRLRPILTTALSFILGCVPLAIASGAGALSRRVRGYAVNGGMTATTLAIFLIPVSPRG